MEIQEREECRGEKVKRGRKRGGEAERQGNSPRAKQNNCSVGFSEPRDLELWYAGSPMLWGSINNNLKHESELNKSEISQEENHFLKISKSVYTIGF